MTTDRVELEIEATLDGKSWQPYVFPYKPGAPGRMPPFVAPHQPRLDWQMWFAALSSVERNPWVEELLARLLEASPPVLALFETVPFEGRPLAVRVMAYRYRFADLSSWRANGEYWTREQLGLYTEARYRSER
jgi:hypothetical protein